MGLLDKFANAADKLANAGAGSRMSNEQLRHARDQSLNTNVRNQIAGVAANPGASRVARQEARAQLVSTVGAHEAEKLIKDANRKVKDSFR